MIAAEAKRPRKTTKPVPERTVDFGCSTDLWAHHLAVHVAEQRAAPILFIEEYGIATKGGAERIERCALSRERWNEVAQLAKQMLNERLKAEGLPQSRWHTGINKVERLLGKELLVLVWAVEAAEPADVAAIGAAWIALRPEERWWLYGKVAAVAGSSVQADAASKVRRGLALLLAGGPGGATPAHAPQRRTRSGVEDDNQLSLLARPPED